MSEVSNYRGCVCLPPPPIVKGEWSLWSPWTPCMGGCYNGTQNRSRTCTDPPPRHEGSKCKGAELETRQCFHKYCNSESLNKTNIYSVFLSSFWPRDGGRYFLSTSLERPYKNFLNALINLGLFFASNAQNYISIPSLFHHTHTHTHSHTHTHTYSIM